MSVDEFASLPAANVVSIGRESGGSNVEVICDGVSLPIFANTLSGPQVTVPTSVIKSIYVDLGSMNDQINLTGVGSTSDFPQLTGTVLKGGAGNDIINGSFFNDRIVGGDGNDTMTGRQG